MSYDVPITITQQVANSLAKRVDDEIYRSVLSVGIEVDRDELLKALKYDRDQYNKGYNDRDKEIVRCENCMYYIDELYCKIDDEDIVINQCICNYEGRMIAMPPTGYCSFGYPLDEDGLRERLEFYVPQTYGKSIHVTDRVAGFKFTQEDEEDG